MSRFEDPVAWQKARQLAAEVYRATSTGPASRDFGFTGQIQRAAVSVRSNIAEGFERGTPREFHRSLLTSKGSIGEVRSLLYLARDIGYATDTQFDALYTLATEVARVVGGLRSSAKRRIDAAEARPNRVSTP